MNEKLKNRIRIRLQSYDHKLLDIACKQILNEVEKTESKIVGPIPLPTKKRVYCVLRSPHVNKDSREHFEIRIHKRVLDIYPTSVDPSNSLITINLPSGVRTTIKS
jgi:small subunit ribosomal protein S10